MAYQPSRRGVDVEKERIADYDRPQPEIPEKFLMRLRKAMDWAKEHFACCRFTTPMTIDEAIEYVKSSDCAQSSCGYPLNQTYHTKLDALNDPEVVAALKEWYNNLGTGGVEAVLWSLSLKDEILKSTKVAAKKTRMFMAAPLFHHVAMVALCGRMHDKLMKDRGTWCSAGRPFQYGGWHAMMSSLRHRWKFGADAEAYDMSINRVLFSAVFELVAYFCPWEIEKLEDLFAMALDAICVTCRGDVIWKHTGNPSGWFLTLFVNTIIMYLLLCVTWMTVFETDHDKNDRGQFETLVHAWLCGDDSLVAVHDSIVKLFTAEEFSSVWTAFGIKTKEIHASENFEQLEYCGATSVLLFERWARRPRVQKFLDALSFTLDNDPLYRLQRAISIYHELWPVPEKEIVLGYIEYLCAKYVYLQKKRRQYELSEARLAELHLGLEGASCKLERTKKIILQGRRVQLLFPGRLLPLCRSLVTLELLCRFTLHMSKKVKKVEKKLIAEELLGKKPTAKSAAVAGGAALAGVAAKQLQKKKKKSPFWGMLAGAARIAAELAPVVGPMLLANHGPTQARIQSAVASGQLKAAPNMGVAPLASGTGVQPMTAVYDLRSVKGADGRVVGMEITGIDYLGAVTLSGASTLGATLFECDLSPYGTQWYGTRLAREASLYERYQVKEMVLIYQPVCPATTAGQVVMYCDADPDDQPIDDAGARRIQGATAHEGAEVGQVWQMVCSRWYNTRESQDYFADASGSDERLISPGKAYILDGAGLAAGDYGTVYCAYKVILKVPQIENMVNGGIYASLVATQGTTATLPMGTATWDMMKQEGNFDAIYLQSNGANSYSTITGLPPGNYIVQWEYANAAGTNTAMTWSTDTINYTQPTFPQSGGLPDGIIGANKSFGAFVLNVAKYTKDPLQGSAWMTGNGGTSITTYVNIFSFARSTASLSRKKKTLQQYERQIDALLGRVAQLEATQMTNRPRTVTAIQCADGTVHLPSSTLGFP